MCNINNSGENGTSRTPSPTARAIGTFLQTTRAGYCYRTRTSVHPRGVPLTLIAPAQVIRRAEVRAESPFSTRRRTPVRQAVENGERKTNLDKKEENLPRLRGRFSTLICVNQCKEFSQSRKLKRIHYRFPSFSGLCAHTRVVLNGRCTFRCPYRRYGRARYRSRS